MNEIERVCETCAYFYNPYNEEPCCTCKNNSNWEEINPKYLIPNGDEE